MADLRRMDINEYAQNGLNDVSGLINRREYKRGIIKARQVAERLVRSYAAERNIEYTTFADTIEQLYAANYINMDTRDAFHTIRIYGNKVVHEADDNSNDAENAFYLLKNEIQTYMSRRNVSIDRTPVKIERGQQASYTNREQRQNRYDADERNARMPVREDRAGSGYQRSDMRTDSSARNPRRNARGAERNRGGHQREERGGIGIYDILKVVIPIIVVILIIIIIKSLIPQKPSVTETSAVETVIETETSEEESTVEETTVETEPETEAPVSYRIKGDGVNVRYADNQARIYTQLSNGTAIGEVTPLEGSDFVQFTLDGVSVVVRKDFIEPVQ